MYDYVRRNYRVEPIVGARVRHMEMRGPRAFGTIQPEDMSCSHYVQVRFDGGSEGSCHPTVLDYAPVEVPS